MEFRQALSIVIGDLTPQPWDYVTGDGATLTVIPAGLRADAGEAEVYVRVTASKTQAAQAGITTTDLPALIAALEQRTTWEHAPLWGSDTLTLAVGGDTVTLAVTEDDHRDGAWDTTRATVSLPEAQRMPLASALWRAMDVARGWES